jgi:hypothetical protein
MRTTVTLDEDVATQLEREMRRSQKSFKRALNDTLRAGFAARQRAAEAPPFEIEARALGTRPGLDYANVAELLEVAEGPDHR